jgi:hypothetical protein
MSWDEVLIEYSCLWLVISSWLAPYYVVSYSWLHNLYGEHQQKLGGGSLSYCTYCTISSHAGKMSYFDETEFFFDLIGLKVLRVFLLDIHSHLF